MTQITFGASFVLALFELSQKKMNSPQEKTHWAAKTIINERKILWYAHGSAQNWNNSQGKVVSLKMEDALDTYGGFSLQKDSEFLPIFNHYLKDGFKYNCHNNLYHICRYCVPIWH